jgi:UDP-N-acetylmuramate dehydrogenase
MLSLRENIQLSEYTTFGVPAVARYFGNFKTLDELAELVDWSRKKDLDSLVLGGGSNMLFTDDFNGTVLHNELSGMEHCTEVDEVYVKVGAGQNWHEFVLHAIAQGWGGVENLSLIPGSVGASPMQNIGAYGVEIDQVFHQLEAWHIEDRELHTFNAEDCEFGYRESVFKRKLKGQYVIVSVTDRLSTQPQLNTRYGAIEQELERMGVSSPTIRDVSNAVINISSSKLPDPREIGNAGSFFKNPVVSMETYHAIKAAHPELVSYPSGDGMKLAAGWLIDQAGWKGYREGDIGVHAKQALVLVNYGNGKGRDIYDLSTRILDDVEKRFGVRLEREVNMIGAPQV